MSLQLYYWTVSLIFPKNSVVIILWNLTHNIHNDDFKVIASTFVVVSLIFLEPEPVLAMSDYCVSEHACKCVKLWKKCILIYVIWKK